MASLIKFVLVLGVIAIGFGLLFFAIKAALVIANRTAMERITDPKTSAGRPSARGTMSSADLMPVRTMALTAFLLLLIVILLVVLL